jgi:tetratricopeptide (TPR) repeat protein
MRSLLLTALVLLATVPAVQAASKELEIARLMSREGKTAEALKAAEAAYKADPADPYAGRLYQDLLAAKGGRLFDWDVPEGMPETVRKYLAARELTGKKRLEALTALAKAEGAPALVKLDLAILTLEEDKARKAENLAKEYTEAAPADPEGFYVLARARAANGNEHAAISSLRKAVELEPGLAAPTVLLSRLQALKLYPKNPTLIAGLGEDQAAQEEYEAAAKSFELAIELEPGVAAHHIRRAEVLIRVEKYKEAMESAAKAVELAPKDDHAHSTLGFAKEKQGDYEGALACYVEASKLAPKKVRHLVDAGFLYIVIGDDKNAETKLKAALELDSKHFDANLTLGTMYYQQEKYREARKYFNAALKVDRKSLEANLSMGYVMLSEGKAKDAIEYFERAGKIDEFDPEPMRMIGRANLSLGKVNDALEALSKAIDRDPKDAWSHFDMGKALEEKGDFDRAKESYRKSIELDDQLPHPHLYLAEIIDEIDDEKEKALPHYKAYLELGGLDPGDNVKERIKQIER